MATKAEADNTPKENALVRSILRNMAWERAKGELRSMLETYAGELDHYRRMSAAINEAIKEIDHQM